MTKELKKTEGWRDWQFLRDWEIEAKRNRLRNLSVKEAFEIFDELTTFLDCIPKKDIEKLGRRREKRLLDFRRNFYAKKK